MTCPVDRISVWRGQHTPLHELGAGVLRVTDDDAVLSISDSRAQRAGIPLTTPQSLAGWPILASKDGTIRYDGEIVEHHTDTTGRGLRRVFRCTPAERVD